MLLTCRGGLTKWRRLAVTTRAPITRIGNIPAVCITKNWPHVRVWAVLRIGAHLLPCIRRAAPVKGQ